MVARHSIFKELDSNDQFKNPHWFSQGINLYPVRHIFFFKT